ncbi:penicillin-binding protein 1A [Variovorax ginsengisoli]|uniref:Penicillin-binding protein 1A n=1 Tax=Variovorax ginsengisoli TaxID=363844 RepID=A0ABT8S3N9_9BURK|nr:PBP1A family penicillin-binding protein [Variovorax ginsengisoli]MDN8613692.1 PBP1A family penicillin-binding protein [Variovorax ginsengisoli]MDO1532862.1 PBP1A family penicillin-binding protein [Variovorax ginsengisoli]
MADPSHFSRHADKPISRSWRSWLLRVVFWFTGLALAAALGLSFVVLTALVVAYPNLPNVAELQDYRPRLPLRVFSSEGILIGEYGEERREFTPISTIPKLMKDAVLAAEDARFYDHNGVDFKSMLRAGYANLNRAKSQGGSTITMQVARNAYLTSEKTVTRKVYEVLLTFKLEQLLTKDQILEIYLNQVFLGKRAYGFAAASEAYFGKPLQDISIAQAAMLAGLPKAPGANNPVNNSVRARERQLYVIDRMQENGFITPEEATAARQEKLRLRDPPGPALLRAEYVAETVRQLIYAQYGDATYTRGLKVYTSISAVDQSAAYKALRDGIVGYERTQIYRGPEAFVDLPDDPGKRAGAIDDALAEHPDYGDLIAAVVLKASAKEVTAVRANGETFHIVGDGLRPVQSGLADKAPRNIMIRRGAVVRLAKTPKDAWGLTQLPEVEGAFVAMDPRDGAIKAMVGGFDFNKNKFNHVTQAWRQPGSSFKPFIYSAALEKGFTPATVVNDGPLYFDAATTGGQPWAPKNYGGTFSGPMPLRTALMKSVNMVTLRVTQSIGIRYAQDWITNFGFDREKHPAYLPMALGAGAVTPMQMATAYSVFANGGYRVNPYLITRITDHKDKVLVAPRPTQLNESMRAIPRRNAFIMDTLLQSVVKGGTGAKAYQAFKRDDLYGKTGTTNDSIDTWFAGFQPTMTAIAWMGYDTPRSLGDKETGSSLSLPIWISFMETAIRGVPVTELQPPDGVVHVGGEWYYEDFAPGSGLANPWGVSAPVPVEVAPPTKPEPPSDERSRIMDLFRN